MKDLKRPEQKDYFEFRGNQIIIDYGHATNFIEAQDEYIVQIEKERDELKESGDKLANILLKMSEQTDDFIQARNKAEKELIK